MRDDHADVSQRAEDQVDSAYGPALPWMGFRTDGCRRAGHAMMKTHVRVVPKGETPTRLCVSNASCGPSDGRSVQQLLHNTQKSTGGPRHPRRLPCAPRARCVHACARARHDPDLAGLLYMVPPRGYSTGMRSFARAHACCSGREPDQGQLGARFDPGHRQLAQRRPPGGPGVPPSSGAAAVQRTGIWVLPQWGGAVASRTRLGCQ